MKICRRCSEHFYNDNWHCPKCSYQPEAVDGLIALDPVINIDELGFNQSSFDRLFELEADNFWFRSRNKLIVWAINKYFKSTGKMLEVGCGTGYVLSGIDIVMPELLLTGNDISSKGLAFARKRVSEVEMVQFDATSIPYENEFDIIGCFDVLEHIKEDQELLKQINKALVAGGGVIITVPQHQFLWSQTDESACHQRRYSAGELKNKLTLAGFEVIRSTSFVTLLFPVMVLARLRKKKNTVTDTTKSELSLNRFINKAFEAVMLIERQLIKMGFNLPFGGSLMILARKAGLQYDNTL